MNVMETLSDDPRDFCFFDTETRAIKGLSDPRWGDVTLSGAGRYARSSKVTLFTYCFGEDGPVKDWQLTDFNKTLRWVDAPPDLLNFMSRALKGEAWFVAWNSGFDRQVCNHGMVRPSKRLVMPVRAVLDAMAQATASNLPSGLDMAAKALKRGGKKPAGKSLIQLFATADGGTPQSHPDEWEEFVDYGITDTDELRHVFLSTRHLWRWEWEQFWTSEVINDRGLPIDRPFVERAAELAGVYVDQVNDRVQEYTRYDEERGEGCWSVNQHVALAKWVADAVEHWPEAHNILVKKYEEDEEGDGLVPAKLSLERTRVEKLIAFIERMDDERGLTDDEYDVLQLLETRLYGASATPKKFAKMLPMLTEEDRLPGQYVFNGAQQTGRFSSRGVQVHNLARSTIEDEDGAIEFINDLELADG